MSDRFTVDHIIPTSLPPIDFTDKGIGKFLLEKYGIDLNAVSSAEISIAQLAAALAHARETTAEAVLKSIKRSAEDPTIVTVSGVRNACHNHIQFETNGRKDLVTQWGMRTTRSS